MVPSRVQADEVLHTLEQSDFDHQVGICEDDSDGDDGDGCSGWWVNTENGVPQFGLVVNGLNDETYPDGLFLDPGYYRLIVETKIDDPAGQAAQIDDAIDTLLLMDLSYVGFKPIHWVNRRPTDGLEPAYRTYYRASFPSSSTFYQTGTFFIDSGKNIDIYVFASATTPPNETTFHVGKVWILRNVDPDPGSLRVLTWNVDATNPRLEAAGLALGEYLNSPDLAAFQEITFKKKGSCHSVYDKKESCLFAIMDGYSHAPPHLVVGDYGYKSGDLFDVYGLGNWMYKGLDSTSNPDHYLGIITKKSAWPYGDYFTDEERIYYFASKGVGRDGDRHHNYGFGTYNCSSISVDCWRCPWYSHTNSEEDCCGLPGYKTDNAAECRNNFYFTNDNVCAKEKHSNGRHVTLEFKDRTGKGGVVVTTHLVAHDTGASCDNWGGDHGTFERRAKQIRNLLIHVNQEGFMYGNRYLDGNPIILLGDMNLQNDDEQYLILDVMRETLSSLGANANVVDVNLSHGSTVKDTHPGRNCGNPDIDTFDKIYLLGDAAAVDNEVEFNVGDFIMYNGGSCEGRCCNEDPCYCAMDPAACREDPLYDDYKTVGTCTGHVPVYATISMKGTKFIEDLPVEGYSARYSGEAGELPSFDMKLSWEEVTSGEWFLAGESRFGDLPLDYYNVEKHDQGAEGMAALFEGEGYIRFPDRGELDATRRVTIEAWVYPTEITTYGEYTIVEKGMEDDVNYMVNITGDPDVPNMGTVLFSVQEQCDDEPGPLVRVNGNLPRSIHQYKWHHILVSYDGLLAKIVVTRVDQLDQVTVLKGESYIGRRLCPNDHPLIIGARYYDGEFITRFHGIMDDLQVYSEVAR